MSGAERTRLRVHFSNATAEWPTPQDLFDDLSFIYGGFTLDPCATPENAKCARYFTKEDDGSQTAMVRKSIREPPLRPRNRPVGKKGLGRISPRHARGLLGSRACRYALVARLREERPCVLPARPPQVRRREQQCSISLGHRDLRQILHALSKSESISMTPIHKTRKLCNPASGSPRS